MDFLEKDLEEIIYSADRTLLEKKGLIITGIAKRQLKIGNYGIADLVTFDRRIDDYDEQFLLVSVYELKKDKVGISTFLQAIRYAKGIQVYLEKRGFKFKVVFQIKLVGRSIDINSDFVYCVDVLPYEMLEIFTYAYDINGIAFKSEKGYRLVNNGFVNNSRRRLVF